MKEGKKGPLKWEVLKIEEEKSLKNIVNNKRFRDISNHFMKVEKHPRISKIIEWIKELIPLKIIESS